MKKQFIIQYAIWIIFSIFQTVNAWGWNDEVTHKSITDYAASNSKWSNEDRIRSIGFRKLDDILIWDGHICDDRTKKNNCTLIDWLLYGSEKEDKTTGPITRTINHFHDPYRNTGLSDVPFPMPDGISALFWAQDSTNQSSALEGDQSWPKLRQIYSLALRHTEDSTRRALFAQLFKGLGHQMHLLQDMAVPWHVRNDAHLGDALMHKSPRGILYFESWAKESPNIINNLADHPVYPAIDFSKNYASRHGGVATCPVSQLWDSDVYIDQNPYPSADTAQGLAEYTNSNFFSEDTIFAAERFTTSDIHHFPYPKQSSMAFEDFLSASTMPEEVWAEDGLRDYRCYIPKDSTDGEAVDHFVAVGYFSSLIAQNDYDPSLYRTFFLDELCHQDYAEKLVPRAVGYSAALLDYFFRGTLQIRHPFVKLASDGTDIFIGGFEFEVKNTSMIGDVEEELKRGSLDLVYRYIPAVTPPENGTPQEPDDNATSPEPVYGLVGPEHILNKATGAPYSINSSNADINSEFVRLSVDLAPEQYIPRDATNLSFTLVYSGTLGHEHDTAVAVGSHRFDQASLADKTRVLFDGQILYGHTPGTPVPGLTYPINLYTVLADGDDLRPLTAVDTTPVTNAPYLAYFQPAWSPDGRLIVYRKNYCSAGGRTELFETPWIGCEDYTEHDHPDHYLYISDLTAGFDENHPVTTLAWPFDFYPGGNPENEPSFLTMPTFAPDSRHVLGVIQESHSFVMNLFVYNIEDRAHALVGGYILSDTVIFKGAMYRKKFYHSVPAWSPDGERIAYYVDEMRNDAPIGTTYPKDIFVLSPSLYRDEGQLIVDGFNDMPLTNDAHFNTQPSWSPDSRWLVFTSNRDHAADDATQAMDIWIMDRNGQNMRRIYNGRLDCMNPGFSPDGTRISFIEGGGAICTVALDGSDYRVIVSANSISDSEGDVLRDILGHLSWSPYLDEFAPTVTLQADAVTVTEGETVTLTWSSTGADRIVLDNGLGDQTQMNGEIDIAPTASATYTVTAYNWAGKATARVSITVE
jgi:Tol biopolymer transport system component